MDPTGLPPTLLPFWPHPSDAPTAGIGWEPFSLMSTGGLPLHGLVWLPPPGVPPKACVALAHPRTDFSVHYACPLLAAAGYAAVGFATRYGNNDVDCLHELAADDVETVLHWVRSIAEPVVVLGNSGGGSLMALAIARAATEGRDLADAFVALAAHPGEGVYMMQAIDPSVTVEGDITSVDPTLDMYSPDNGWRPWPEPARYDPDWVARYREAQRARVARLDEAARMAIADREDAAAKEAGAVKGSDQWNALRRRAVAGRYMTVYRTLADPAYLDPSIDPDDRPLGSIFAFGGDPLDANYGWFGLARVTTARAWLSTWSGLSSSAAIRLSMPEVLVPTLVIHPTADTEIRLHQGRAVFEESGSETKEFVALGGADHYLRGRRQEVVGIIDGWIEKVL